MSQLSDLRGISSHACIVSPPPSCCAQLYWTKRVFWGISLRMTAAGLSKRVANVTVSVFHKDKGRITVDRFSKWGQMIDLVHNNKHVRATLQSKPKAWYLQGKTKVRLITKYKCMTRTLQGKTKEKTLRYSLQGVELYTRTHVTKHWECVPIRMRCQKGASGDLPCRVTLMGHLFRSPSAPRMVGVLWRCMKVHKGVQRCVQRCVKVLRIRPKLFACVHRLCTTL
jgi:hypothetical protein